MLSKLKKRRASRNCLADGTLPSRKSEAGTPAKTDAGRGTASATSRACISRRSERTIVLHHDGYGFVVPDAPMPQLDGDVFIPRDAIQDACTATTSWLEFSGWAASRAHSARRAHPSNPGRAHPTVVGLFRYGTQQNAVLPYDVRIQHEVEIPRGKELTPG